MSDTPRTDAIALRSLNNLAYMEMINDLAGLARQLERELSAAINKPQIPDAPEGYRYELIRLSTPSDPTPQGRIGE